MKDEINSIKTTVYERLASPLTGSFIISWLIINWKVVLTVFSSEKYSDKINYIVDLYPMSWSWAWLWFCEDAVSISKLFLLPALGAILYVCIYQWVITQSLKVWTYHENKKKEALQKRVYTQEYLDMEIMKRERIIKDNNNTIQADRQTTEYQKTTIAELREQLNSKEKEVIAEKNRSTEAIKNIQKDINMLQSEASAAQRDKTSAEEKLNNATVENKKLIQSINSLNADLQKTKNDLKVETDKNKDYVNDLKKCNTEISSLKKERNGAIKALSEVKDQFDEILNQLPANSSRKKEVMTAIEGLFEIIGEPQDNCSSEELFLRKSLSEWTKKSPTRTGPKARQKAKEMSLLNDKRQLEMQLSMYLGDYKNTIQEHSIQEKIVFLENATPDNLEKRIEIVKKYIKQLKDFGSGTKNLTTDIKTLKEAAEAGAGGKSLESVLEDRNQS